MERLVLVQSGHLHSMQKVVMPQTLKEKSFNSMSSLQMDFDLMQLNLLRCSLKRLPAHSLCYIYL